ncbi:MAG TPA: peptidase S8, partial [Lachnospiraceae bacterium]|nr:peptidase S8 [Lachnospiraceae bacterium]
MEESPIHKILDENYFDLLIENTLAKNFDGEYDITRINDRNSIIHMPENKFNMCIMGRHPYHTFPSIYTPNSLVSLEKSGVTAVWNNPNLALFGQGILIGFVDTGIDYQHEAFLNVDGTTRLFSIWDQTIVNGMPPSRFEFGAEYNKTQINIALREDNPLMVVPSIDEDGHGTMLAGIAAGNPNPQREFSGVAPEAELVVVKLAPAKYYNRKVFGIDDTVLCYAETNIFLGV